MTPTQQGTGSPQQTTGCDDHAVANPHTAVARQHRVYLTKLPWCPATVSSIMQLSAHLIHDQAVAAAQHFTRWLHTLHQQPSTPLIGACFVTDSKQTDKPKLLGTRCAEVSRHSLVPWCGGLNDMGCKPAPQQRVLTQRRCLQESPWQQLPRPKCSCCPTNPSASHRCLTCTHSSVARSMPR